MTLLMTLLMCASGGKKCSFFGKFGVLYFLETLVMRFVLFALLSTNISIALRCFLLLCSNVTTMEIKKIIGVEPVNIFIAKLKKS